MTAKAVRSKPRLTCSFFNSVQLFLLSLRALSPSGILGLTGWRVLPQPGKAPGGHPKPNSVLVMRIEKHRLCYLLGV